MLIETFHLYVVSAFRRTTHGPAKSDTTYLVLAENALSDRYGSLRVAGVNNFFTVFKLFSYLVPHYRLVDEGDVTSNAKRSAGILFPG